MLRQSGILLLVLLSSFAAAAQDTLPKFTLVNKGNNRIIISWNNPYGQQIHQLSIQRSPDSTKNFRSILTLPDPTVPQNGYADTKALHDHMYYRLYILLDSGKYIFSKSKKPILDTVRIKESTKEIKPAEQPVYEAPKVDSSRITPVPAVKTKEPEKRDMVKPEPVKPKEIPERIIYIKKRDTLIGQVGERSVRRFRDSVATRSKDTLTYSTPDTIVIKPFVPKEVYKPSKYVFTEKDGNIKIILPQADEKKYTLKFFDDSGATVLEIKQIKEPLLTLDKSNFSRAGWYKFELYEDDILKEKHKLFIPKDF